MCTNLHVVWQKYSTGEAAGNAAGYVNDADPEAASKFLQISHDKVLEHNCDDQLQQPAGYSHTYSRSVVHSVLGNSNIHF